MLVNTTKKNTAHSPEEDDANEIVSLIHEMLNEGLTLEDVVRILNEVKSEESESDSTSVERMQNSFLKKLEVVDSESKRKTLKRINFWWQKLLDVLKEQRLLKKR
jgi:hypothetical protein